jgi:predicted permease
MSALDVLVPIFGIILLGWALQRIGLMPSRLLDLINNYVYYIGITVITFVSLHDTSWSILLDPEIYVLSLAPLLAAIAIAMAAARLLKLEGGMFALFVICAFYGNTGYIGFPLNVIVQGHDSLNMAAFVSTIHTIVVFTIGIYLLKRYTGSKSEAGKLHKLPILWAALLGVMLSWVAIPDLVRLPLSLISDSTSPLALLATGAMVRGASLKTDLKEIGVLSAIKLIVLPAMVILTGLIMNSSGLVYRTSLLEAATPVAVTNSVLAAQFKTRYDFASQAVIISTILFAVTLTILLLII